MHNIYSIASKHERLPGASEAYNVRLNGVAKQNLPNAPYIVANEFLCAEIGKFIGLPIPPFGLMRLSAEPDIWFVGVNFNSREIMLPPVDGKECVQKFPDLSTGLSIFDIFVCNNDRHANNLSIDLTVQPVRMDVFDHSHALFGSARTDIQARFNTLRDGVQVGGHVLIPHITSEEHFEKWLHRIESIPEALIKEACDRLLACNMTEGDMNAASDFLIYRRSNIRKLVSDNRSLFTSILHENGSA